MPQFDGRGQNSRMNNYNRPEIHLLRTPSCSTGHGIAPLAIDPTAHLGVNCSIRLCSIKLKKGFGLF